MNDLLKPVTIDGVVHVPLKIRNIGGEGVLFTEDGEMIGHQVAHMGHYYYVGHGKDRVKMYRATVSYTHLTLPTILLV